MPYKRRYVSKKKRVPRRARASTGMKRRTLATLVKRIVMRKTESKCRRHAFEKAELYHNAFYGVPATGFVANINSYAVMPAQGAGDNQRIGDQVYLTGFRLKMLIGQKADRPNVSFRYYVLKVPKGSSITYGNWFNSTTGNILLDDPNTDFVKVLLQGLWRPNEAGLANVSGDEYTFAKRLWVPYKKLLKFGPADAATTHNDDDIYFVLMAYDAFGTLVSDNIAYVQMGQEIFYRDP